MRGRVVIGLILLVQAFCALFFVSDIIFSVLGIYARPLAWQTREFLELGAALGLLLAVVLGGVAIHRIAGDRRRAEEKLRRAV